MMVLLMVSLTSREIDLDQMTGCWMILMKVDHLSSGSSTVLMKVQLSLKETMKCLVTMLGMSMALPIRLA